MTTADDDPWAPLPVGAEQHRPGESVELRAAAPQPAATVASAVAKPAAKAEASPGDDAAQLAALRELAARAAQQPKKPSSLVGAVLQREQRQRTARPAKPESPAAEARAEQPSGAAPPTAPAAAASRSVVPIGVVGGSPDAPTTERDPRELEPWFLQLPAAEQQRLRAAWRNQHERLRVDLPWRQRERNRRSTTAMAGFVVVGVLGGSPMVLALCAGGLCAIAWRYTRPDRFGDPFVALLCYYVVCAIAAVIHGGVSPSLVFDSILVAAITSLLGFEGEIRATGGFASGR